MSDFPISITAPTDPIASDTLASVPHATQHQNHNAEIVAIETKIGTGASTPSAGKVLRATGTGTSAWAQVDPSTDFTTMTSATLRGLLTDETGTGVAVFATSPTITKPVIDATDPSAQTYSPAGAGTATLDLSLANEHRISMPAGNITIALSNATNAQKFIISITQDSVGSRTVTWFTTIRWFTAGAAAPTLTTTANKRDTFGFIRTGSNTYDGFVVGQGG